MLVIGYYHNIRVSLSEHFFMPVQRFFPYLQADPDPSDGHSDSGPGRRAPKWSSTAEAQAAAAPVVTRVGGPGSGNG